MERSPAVRAIFWGGLIAGILDITYAFVQSGLHGVGPILVLQSVASGLLGRPSYEGGLATAALGLALHFLIATVWTAVYYAASRKLTFMVSQWVACGLLYGVVVYLFMNFVVLPLSRIAFTPRYGPTKLTIDIIGHMLLVGLPMAFATRRFGARA